MGNLAFSPTLTLWFNQKILWSLIYKKLTGGMVTSCQICQLSHCCGVDNPLSVSAEVAHYNYQAAKKEYQELHPNSGLAQHYLPLGLTHQKS